VIGAYRSDVHKLLLLLFTENIAILHVSLDQNLFVSLVFCS